jgi:hypothetical protein
LGGPRYQYDRLALPLRAGGNTPAMILTFVNVDPRRLHEFWSRYFGETTATT